MAPVRTVTLRRGAIVFHLEDGNLFFTAPIVRPAPGVARKRLPSSRWNTMASRRSVTFRTGATRSPCVMWRQLLEHGLVALGSRLGRKELRRACKRDRGDNEG